MNHPYADIKALTTAEPTWYDDNGTPRYCQFTPEAVPNIYANTAILVRIKCQCCETLFLVSMSESTLTQYHKIINGMECTETQIKNKQVPHYGDPPFHDCTGDSMNCYDLQIVEFHKKNQMLKWERITDYEFTVDPKEEEW